MAFVFAPLFSGSSGNALYIQCDETRLMVDAGLACKRIEQEAVKAAGDISKLDGLLITHEHSDHVAGAGIIARKYHTPIYVTGPTWEAMAPKIGKVDENLVHIIDPGEEFVIGQVRVRAFSIPHDAACPVGYTFTRGNTKLSVATDIGELRDDWMKAVENSDMLLLESNHDVDMLRAGRYTYDLKKRILGSYGHLSNDQAGKAAVQLALRGVRQILLGHLSQENNFPELAWESVAACLRMENINIPIGVASRSGLSGRYLLDGEPDHA